jgi:hypothetical protein
LIALRNRFDQAQAPVAHTWTHNYSGGRDQENHGSKPARGKGSQDPISKNPSQKRAGGVAQGTSSEIKSYYHKGKGNIWCIAYMWLAKLSKMVWVLVKIVTLLMHITYTIGTQTLVNQKKSWILYAMCSFIVAVAK